METEMGFLNELCRQVREQHNICLEGIGRTCDMATSSICRYELGEREVPFRYVRALWWVTKDARLLHFFDPDIAKALDQQKRSRPAAKRVAPAGDPKDLLPAELAAVKELAEAAEYVNRIVIDGKVDDTDNLAIGNLLHKHAQIRELLDATDAALVAFRQAQKGGAH